MNSELINTCIQNIRDQLDIYISHVKTLSSDEIKTLDGLNNVICTAAKELWFFQSYINTPQVVQVIEPTIVYEDTPEATEGEVIDAVNA